MLLCMMISSSCNIDTREADGARQRGVRDEVPSAPCDVLRILMLMLLSMILPRALTLGRQVGHAEEGFKASSGYPPPPL